MKTKNKKMYQKTAISILDVIAFVVGMYYALKPNCVVAYVCAPENMCCGAVK